VAVLLAVGALCLLGYGNDIDVANVRRSGGTWLADGVYRPSRPPGVPIHELGSALLDRLGGSVAIALGSVALGALAAWSVASLVRGRGAGAAGLSAGVLVANPWFVIAATSLNDATWALGLALAGGAATHRGHRLGGAVLFGLAIGCRSSAAVLAVAWFVAERLGDRSRRPSWGASTAAVALVGTVATVCFVPVWWAAHRSLDFLDLEIDFVGWAAHAGRWGIKNLVVATVPGAIALAVAAPSLRQNLRGWRSDVVVRFAVLTICLGEVLFLRFPLKPVHLLPVVAAVAILSAGARRAIVIGLIAAQGLGGLVSVRVAAPDTTDRATGADAAFAITGGPLLEDVRCRLRDRDDGGWPAWSTEAARLRAARNFACQNRAWRGSSPSTDPLDGAAAARP
jgi:hypothetical protein